MAKNLGGLAALAALGYMAKKMGDKVEAPTSAAYEDIVSQAKPSKAATQDQVDLEQVQKYGDQYLGPQKVTTPGRMNRAPVKAKPKVITGVEGGDQYLAPDPRDRELGMSRGMRGAGVPKTNLGDSYALRQQGIDERKRLEEADKPLENVYPEQVLLGGGSGVGLKAMNRLAQNLANRGANRTLQTIEQQALPAPAKSLGQQALPSPTPRLPYDKAGAVNRAREARAAGRNEEMLRENASRYGLDPDNINPATANVIRQNLGGKDFSLGMKRGGMVKKMANGGMTSMPKASSASRRGDGIATKGKTRGKIC